MFRQKRKNRNETQHNVAQEGPRPNGLLQLPPSYVLFFFFLIGTLLKMF